MKYWPSHLFKRLEINVLTLEIFGLLCAITIFVMMIGNCVFGWW